MTKEEYRSARSELGLSVELWCDEMGISVHAHKKYNAGTRPVPLMLELSIKKSIELSQMKAPPPK